MELREFQKRIYEIYYAKDKKRGKGKTFIWFTEEIGELARTLRTSDREGQKGEFADVLAWLTSLANLYEIDLEEVARKYTHGCPRCGRSPCECEEGFIG